MTPVTSSGWSVRRGCAGCLARGNGGATGTNDGQWRVYSGDNAATKYSPVDQINSANVRTLKVA